MIFNFFLKADIEDQFMHLDSDILSNGTNYKFQFHRKVGDFWGKSGFFAILSDFFLLFKIGLTLRFLLTHLNDLL